jgi:hypothetical protein
MFKTLGISVIWICSGFRVPISGFQISFSVLHAFCIVGCVSFILFYILQFYGNFLSVIELDDHCGAQCVMFYYFPFALGYRYPLPDFRKILLTISVHIILI